ncbi:MAG TPA: PQQ-dependent sugar dehydrogenase [Stellaceae bacterium]|nr:PQQ-dependent sugar dehydrogenase [Stellaceae bacterium]
MIAPILFAASLAAGLSTSAGAQELKHYDSSGKGFWQKPPPDWFLGDETSDQKGLSPPPNPALPTSLDELNANLKNIKLPPGFSIAVYASGLPEARQMAFGDKGTLFVGSFGATNVYAVVDQDGKKVVKTIVKGLNMPTGVAFRDGALYVVAIDKILRFDNAEANLDHMPEPVVVYDDMPSYAAHGWKYLVFDKAGWVYVPFGPPFNIGNPPSSVSQVRRIDLTTGAAEIVALGVRNSVGGDIDPRTGQYWFTENARDWISDDLPSDKLNHITKVAQHFGYPYCHQGDLPDPKFAQGHTCSEFTPPVANLGAHVAPLGMKFYTGKQFPPEYQNNIFIAEHGSWNRHNYQGGRIERMVVDADGSNPHEETFASGWIKGPREYTGRPDDVIVAADGSMLISDDWAGAVYRISYTQ